MSFGNGTFTRAGWLVPTVFLAALTACGDPDDRARSHEAAGRPGSQAPVPPSPSQEPEEEKREEAPPPPAGPGEDYYENRAPGLFLTPAVALFQLLKVSGDSTASYRRLLRSFPDGPKKITFGLLKDYLSKQGIKSEVRKEPLSTLLKTGKPAIVPTRTQTTSTESMAGAFILLLGRTERGIRILEPMAGIRVVTEDHLGKRSMGINLRLEQSVKRPPHDAPDLMADEIFWSYGEVPSGTKFHHSFRLRNAGTRPLKISRMMTNCGCAAAVVSNKDEVPEALINAAKAEKHDNPRKYVLQKQAAVEIPPGKSSWITIYVNTLYKEGDRAFGVIFNTNDPDEPEFTMAVNGRIIRVFEHEPTTLWFQHVPSSEGASAHLWIRHHSGKPFEITDIKSTSRNIAVAVDPDPPREHRKPKNRMEARLLPPGAHPENKGWVGLEVRLLPGFRVGKFSERISLRVNGTLIEAQVSGLVKGDIKVDPPYFNFDHIEKGEARKVEVTVSSRLGKAFKIDGVEASKDFMHIHLEATGKGVYRISVSLEKGWESHNLEAVVFIHSNDPLEPRKKVDVFGFIKRR